MILKDENNNIELRIKMMKQKIDSEKLKKILKIILLIIAILIIIVLIILIQINKKNSKKTPIENATTEQIEQENENAITNNISQMSEKSRIESYVGEFISLVEEKDYEKAYDKLNENFKNNYFKTIDDFKNYVEKKYPANVNIEYGLVTRMGKGRYLVETKITDVLDTDFAEISQRFVVRENGANDYKISFEAN